MNWEQSARWEQNLEIYESLKRIESLLQKLVENTAPVNIGVPYRSSKKVITTEVALSEREQEVLNNLDIIDA